MPTTTTAELSTSLDEPVDTKTVLRHWLNEGWKFRGFDKLPRATQKEYIDRTNYEFDLMESKDFLDYFAVLGDVVRTAKDREIAVGPARGSAAASLCCYLWRITEVNPMAFPLMLFERFIAPDRNDEPDIDLDFEDDRRDEVRKIMIEKYGEDRVGNIGTFTRYRGKNAIDDVARVYQIPKGPVDGVKEYIVERSGGDSRFDASIMDTVEMFPQVKEVFDQYPELYRSIELEGNYKAFGVHAAGLVIGAEPLSNYVATYEREVGTGVQKRSLAVLSVDKYDGEHLGLMKLDALGLSTMGMLRIALDFLGMSLGDLYSIPMDDEATLAAFERNDVQGIFQFEGRTMKLVNQEMRPKTFMDLAAVNALARPGPLNSGSAADYLNIRHGRKERHDIHPMLTKICDPTEGQIIYQEQILQICGDIGKLPWTHRNAIRKIISARKGESAFNALWDEFNKGAASQGISEEIAKEVWKRMVTAGTYAFNIAHCVSYSMLGFWAMWLKVHHPREFYAAQLRKTPHDDKEKDIALMRDMTKFGRSLTVLPPDPGESGLSWVPTADGVRAGLLQVPGIGETTAGNIIAFRDTMPDPSAMEWADMIAVKGVGGKTIEKIELFASEEDPFGIYKLQKEITEIRAWLKAGAQAEDGTDLPVVTHTSDDVPYDDIGWKGVILGRLRARNLQDLFENYRSRTGEDLDEKTVKRPDLKDSMTLYLEDEEGMLTVKVNRFSYPKFKAEVWAASLRHDYILARVQKYANSRSGKTVFVEQLWPINPD